MHRGTIRLEALNKNENKIFTRAIWADVFVRTKCNIPGNISGALRVNHGGRHVGRR